MLVPFLIMLREGIEAALIVGIIASFLRHTDRAALMPAVWAGVFFALGLSLFAGAGLQWMAAEFPQKQQELFEAVVGFIAVGMLTGMVFWMRKAARSIKSELQASVDKALSTSGSASWALIGMVFLAVAREGLESVFFLLAIFQQSTGWGAAVGALAGIALSILLGVGLYKGGVRINMRQFFRYTGVFILLVAAGLLAGAVRRLHEAGVWNHLQQVVFDSSAVLPEDSALGVVLGGLLGYMHAPVQGEVLAWAAYLVVTLAMFFWPAQAVPAVKPSVPAADLATQSTPHASATQPASLGGVVLGSVLVLVLGAAAFWQAAVSSQSAAKPGGDGSPAAAAAADVPQVTIEISQGRCTPNAVSVPAGKVQFRIVNKGERALEWEILDGVMVLEERENILPGLSQTLTARLAPGQYQMTCGLLNAPRGTLTVTPSDAFKAEAAKPPVTAFIGALAEYQVYLLTEVASLQDMLQALPQRLQPAGDAAQQAPADGYPADALQLVALARGQYQKLVPLAAQFGDLNARIDARAADFALRDKDPAFVGLHRIAVGLKAAEGAEQLLPLITSLQQDVEQLAQRLGDATLQPQNLATNSAKALERASTLIPGEATTPEEGRWALQFVRGSLAAADKTQQLLAPVLANANPALLQQLQASLEKVRQLLADQGVSADEAQAATTPGVLLNPVQCQNLAQALYQASQSMGKINMALGLQP
ncbi:high-affinity iron transporter [Comamonas odontotermitis]|uniref:High-affinity iron transporter n=1 Tax=Comamonas odontotermitis TaxID=379895 RepID=A0ABR6RL64_9BURK|nr:iron uptake transporter permease EfeU [Comamonas odontotermitis]MBB6579797.1 high-affinity iron transporter [Comamonas odontotermitis]